MSCPRSGGPAFPPTWCQAALGPLTGSDRCLQLQSLLRQVLCGPAAENCPPASLLRLASPAASPHGPLGPAPPVSGMLPPWLGQQVPLHGTAHPVTRLEQSLAIPSSLCPHRLSGDCSVHSRDQAQDVSHSRKEGTTEPHGALCQPCLHGAVCLLTPRGSSVVLAGSAGLPEPTDLGLRPACFTWSEPKHGGVCPANLRESQQANSVGRLLWDTALDPAHHGSRACTLLVARDLTPAPQISRHAQGWCSAAKPSARGPSREGGKATGTPRAQQYLGSPWDRASCPFYREQVHKHLECRCAKPISALQ